LLPSFQSWCAAILKLKCFLGFIVEFFEVGSQFSPQKSKLKVEKKKINKIKAHNSQTILVQIFQTLTKIGQSFLGPAQEEGIALLWTTALFDSSLP